MYDSLRTWAAGPAVMVEALLVVAVVTWVWALPRSLRTPASERGLVSLALAQTPSRARQIRAAWARIGRLGTARRALGWELVLIVLYAAALLLGIVLAARLADTSGLLSSTQADDAMDAAPRVVGAAVVLDVLENIGCVWLLRPDPNPFVSAGVWNFAFLKFALILFAGISAFVLAAVGGAAAAF